MNNTNSAILGSGDHVLIYSAANKLENGRTLYEVMTGMWTQIRGAESERSQASLEALRIMHLVERYTQLHEGISADSVRAADVYIDSFDSLAEAEWAMRQILRGLNPEKHGDVSTDGNIMVFAREAGATDRYDLMSYNELREELISRLSRLNMSYKGMTRLFKLVRGADYSAAAAAFGRDGYELKCLTAMHMYLSNPGMSIEQAAMNACYGVDFQAVCDAVNIGRVTASSASCILLVSAVPFAFMALELIASSTTIGSLVISCGVIALTASALCQLYEYLPEAAGATGITLVNLVKKGAETVERGWERLCESLERNGDYDYDDDYIGEEEDEAAFADPDYPF